MIDLTGKHVLVAGGSRGIGASAALMAAQAGADVSIIYRSNQEAADHVVSQVHALGGRAMAVQADASVEAQIVPAIAQLVDKLGAPQGVVVSAGIFEGLPLADMTVEFWDRMMAVNVRGTFLAVRECAKAMRAGHSGGSIVIYTSTAGQRGSSVYSAYATSKGAQIMFMRSMARELAPDRIRVNCIAPGWTETDMANASLTQLGRDEVAKEFPLGRIGMPDDVAGATTFLLSDLASFVTGMTLTVDGGYDMRG